MPWRIYSIEHWTTPNIARFTAMCKWKEMKDSDGRGNNTEREERKKQKSKENPGWQDGGNMTGIDMLQ